MDYDPPKKDRTIIQYRAVTINIKINNKSFFEKAHLYNIKPHFIVNKEYI